MVTGVIPLMSDMEVEVEYLSSGINQTPLGINWGPDDMVCMAASTGVLLYDPKVRHCQSKGSGNDIN